MGDHLILVVDDYEDVRAAQATMLTSFGFRVAEARDGLEAIQLVRELSPAIILLDLSMPRMDGFEAARHLKANEQTRGIPIIAISAGANEEESFKAGCDFFLRKPIPPDKLFVKIYRALRKPLPPERRFLS